MADPSPFSFLDLSLNRGLLGPVPHFLVGDNFGWPPDVEDQAWELSAERQISAEML